MAETERIVRLGEIPVLSANGPYLAFAYGFGGLVPNDLEGEGSDVFLLDLATQQIQLVSASSQGANGNNFGFDDSLSISADGRYVAFASDATNLVPNDNNNALDVFLRDVVAGTTERISVNSAGQEAVGGQSATISSDATVSDDGRYIAFVSRSANLVDAPFAPFNFSIYLRDRLATTNNPGNTPSPIKTIVGNAKNNRLVGSKGADLLSGLGGSDRLTVILTATVSKPVE